MTSVGPLLDDCSETCAVVPDRVDAEPLGCYDFPFKIIADHPGLMRADAEHFYRMIVGPLLGLAQPCSPSIWMWSKRCSSAKCTTLGSANASRPPRAARMAGEGERGKRRSYKTNFPTSVETGGGFPAGPAAPNQRLARPLIPLDHFGRYQLPER
jgi:hypothetical protein